MKTLTLLTATLLSTTALAQSAMEPLPREVLRGDRGSLILPRGFDAEDLGVLLGRMARTHEPVSPLAAPAPTEPTNYGGQYNMTRCDIDVDVVPDTGQMDVVSTVTLTMNKAGDKIAMFFPPFELSEVTDLDGVPIPYEQKPEFQLLTLLPEVAAEKGQEVSFILRYSGKPDCGGGGYVKACEFKKSLSYLTHARYYPVNNAVMLDMFRTELRITVPTGLTVAATGRLVEVTEDAEAGKSTFHFTHDFETELVSFAMADYETLTDESGEYPITLYVRSDKASNMPNLLTLAQSILAFYAEVYAPFPFNNLDIVEIGNSFGGGYGPQATIMMLSDIFGVTPVSWYYDGLVQLMSHELAHQYWGNLVNIASADSVSVSEGLAEFSSAWHYENDFGTRSNFVQNGMNYMYTVPFQTDMAIGSSTLYGSPYYQTIAYDKASVVFDMLRHEVGEEAFIAGMQLYIATYGYSAASIQEFFQAHETASGKDLGWFFSQWMLRTGSPVLHVGAEVVAANGGWDVTLRVEQKTKPFQMHLPVQATLRDGTKVDLEPVWVDGESVTATRHLDQAPLRLSTDPTRTLLQRTRGTLPGDVNLSGSADGSDLLDMAMMFRRDIVVKYGNNDYFIPNGGYLPRFDLNEDGRIDESDLELLLQGLGGSGFGPSVIAGPDPGTEG
ncbi:MAG: hypothetical protein AMXMBFR64_02990 [Myxococcales bacterium]